MKDKEQLDREDILENTNMLNFAYVSDHFRLIDGADYTVYIPVGEAAGLLSRLRFSELSRAQLRKLGEYSVNVYKQYFQALYDAGAIEKISEKAGILTNINLYSTETGLPFEISEQDNAIFI